MNHQSITQDKDPQLWRIAKRRALFKYSLVGYVIMNIFFWVVWYFTGQHTTPNGWPWPIWPMIVWGLALAIHFFRGYVYQRDNATMREYEKLKQDQNK